MGSSPLARGLPAVTCGVTKRQRIIPARAGFTPSRPIIGPAGQDHPRSRGVYGAGLQGSRSSLGSSPLARGLLAQRRGASGRRGIIPARAGFTRAARWCPLERRDHPRSRGVYSLFARMVAGVVGSSPLARGLPPAITDLAHAEGIIPARAGFTRRLRGEARSIRDHPRSRGVYTCGSLESQRRVTLPDYVCLHCRPSARSAEFR